MLSMRRAQAPGQERASGRRTRRRASRIRGRSRSRRPARECGAPMEWYAPRTRVRPVRNSDPRQPFTRVMNCGRTLVATACLVVTACGSVQPGTASSTRTSASAPRVASPARTTSPCPVSQLPATFPGSSSSTHNLVIAKLRGSAKTVIRDVTDIEHPSTVATLDLPTEWAADGWASPSFVSSSTISYPVDDVQLVLRSVSGSSRISLTLACKPATIVTYRWSPDGQSFTYVLEPASWITDFTPFEWHLVSGGADRVIGHAPAWCHCGSGSDEFSVDAGFSSDRRFVSLVDAFGAGSALQVRRLDGSVVGHDVRGDQSKQMITMGVWSGTDLFFRDPKGVERWRDGTIKPFLSGVGWLHPSASPKGGQIVYAARGSDHLARVYVVDTTTGQRRQLLGQPRTSPIFLTSRYVWYRGERRCGQNEPGICNMSTLSGKTYIYDLNTGTEFESVITDIADVWPHSA